MSKSSIRAVGVASVLIVTSAIIAVTVVVGRAQADLMKPVTYQDLLNGLKDPTRWLVYSGDYSGRRHSPLMQITPENASHLVAQWTFQTQTMARGRGFEATPLAIDG